MKRGVWFKALAVSAFVGLAAFLAFGVLGEAEQLVAADSQHAAVASSGDNDNSSRKPSGKAAEAAEASAALAAPGSDGSGKMGAESSAAESEITPYEVLKKLPSIDSLFSGNQKETICGPDDRSRVTATTTYPWRANCQLVMTNTKNQQFIGTGWMGGRGTVFTAGHCVHDGKGGSFFKKIEVIPGMNGSSRPYGTFFAKSLRTVTGWANSSSPDFDYGAIILASNQKIGIRTGYYGFGVLSNAQFSNLGLNTAGYPGDKPFGEQWRAFGHISSVTSTRLFYDIDTFGGQSGSVVYRFNANTNERLAVGVHAYGGCPNGATRINTQVFNNLLAWRNLNQ